MSAREVVERTLYRLGSFLPEDEAYQILEDLQAAGYRILAPGELDAETLGRVAEFTQNEFQRDFESPVGWRGQFVAALRALEAQEGEG